MGVKGLSTFVDNNHRLLSQHKLHDCRIVIDANNFMYFLFFHHQVSFKFGGDYDQYARKCKHFFNTLRACNVKPYVVFDGGYDPDDRKLPTVLERRLERIVDVDRICSKGRGSVLPILAIETFKQALEELDIPHVSCQFEADREIAVLAYRWACPVLSNDSDFFIYNLEGGVIPLDYINLTLCTCHTKSGETLVLESDHTLSDDHFKYIPVKLYHYSRFAQKYPEDVRKLVLPVFGSLLGNDFVDEKQLFSFYSHADVPCGEKLKFKIMDKNYSRMITSLHWLDRVKTRENVFDRVLEYITEDIRDEVKTKLKRSLDDYCDIDDFASIDLEKFFSQYDVPKPERSLESIVFPELLDYHEKRVPEWLVSALRRCKIGHALQNAIVLHRVIQYCQIELLGRPTTYTLSQRIREFSYGLFLPGQIADDSNKMPSRESHIVEYDRHNKSIKKFYVSPLLVGTSQTWDVFTVPNSHNKEDRLKILFTAVDFTQHPLLQDGNFSNTVLLIISMLCLWIQGADPKISKTALMSLLTTILYLNVRALHWYENKLKSGHGRPPKPCVFDDVDVAFSNSSEYQVNHFIERLEKYTRKPEKKDKKPRDFRIIHGFSQFQAILMDTILLNQLLACPVPLFSPGFLYSGTTVYNLCIDLDYRSKPDLFIGDLMVLKSPLHTMFTTILEAVIDICTDNPLQVKLDQSSKKSKKKKKKKSRTDTSTQSDNKSDSETPKATQVKVASDLCMDNRFALLNLDN